MEKDVREEKKEEKDSGLLLSEWNLPVSAISLDTSCHADSISPEEIKTNETSRPCIIPDRQAEKDEGSKLSSKLKEVDWQEIETHAWDSLIESSFTDHATDIYSECVNLGQVLGKEAIPLWHSWVTYQPAVKSRVIL